MADSGQQRIAAKREVAGVEDLIAETKEDEEHGELKRVHQVIGDLRSDQVEAKDEGDGEAEQGGGAEERIDADRDADGEGPSKTAWRGSHTQEMQDWGDDLALEDPRSGGGERFGHASPL